VFVYTQNTVCASICASTLGWLNSRCVTEVEHANDNKCTAPVIVCWLVDCIGCAVLFIGMHRVWNVHYWIV